MNPNNYASVKASKRLVEAGIVLQTDHYWASIDMKHWDLCFIPHKVGFKEYPAPSMAEVWRELPHNSVLSMGGDGESWVQVDYDDPQKTLESVHRSFNPTNALIDLLIWLRKEASHE